MAAIAYPPNNTPSTPAGDYTASPWTAPNGTQWLYDATKTRWTAYSAGGGSVSDDAYDATSWNGVTDVAPSKNAVRDELRSMEIEFLIHSSRHASDGDDPLSASDVAAVPEAIVHASSFLTDVILSNPAGYGAITVPEVALQYGKRHWYYVDPGVLKIDIGWELSSSFWYVLVTDSIGTTLYSASMLHDGSVLPFELTGWTVSVGSGDPAFSQYPPPVGVAVGQRMRLGASAPYDWYSWNETEWVYDGTEGDASTLPVARGGTGATTASTARTNLGAGTTGAALFTAATVAAANTVLGISTRTKASATARTNNSEALDPELTGDTLEANTTYEVDFYLPITADAAGGIRFGFSVPSLLQPAGSFGLYVRESGALDDVAATSSTYIGVRTILAACTTGLCGHFRFRTGGSGGNFGVFWAQHTSNAAATTLLAGASYTITKR